MPHFTITYKDEVWTNMDDNCFKIPLLQIYDSHYSFVKLTNLSNLGTWIDNWNYMGIG